MLQKNTANASVKWVYPSLQTERLYDLNSRSTRLNEKVTTIASADVDTFGNVKKMTVVTDNGFHKVQTVIASTFDTNYTTSSWWPRKLSSQAKTTQTISRNTTVAANILSGTDAARTTTTTYSYNSDGITHRKPTQIVTSASDTPKTHQVSHVFNSYGLPTSTTQVGSGSGSDLNRATSFGYSTDGYFVASVTNDKGHVSSRLTSAEHGQPVSETDANGTTVTYTYDPFGRMTSQSVPGGAPIETGLISCTFSCESSAATYYRFTQQEGSPLQKVFYDLLNRERMKAVTGFGGLTVYSRVDYNARGDKTFESVPSHSTNSTEGTTFVSFDALGRVTRKETDRAEGGWLVTDYIYSGHTTSIEANDGITLFMNRTHGGDGKLIRTKDAHNGYTRYAYDSAGNPITLQDAKGASIYAFYNGLGHKTEVRDPNMGTKLFSYNTFGEVEFETDAKSVVTQTIYDGLGRVVTRKIGSTVQASYAYDSRPDGIGLLSTESAVGHQANYYYDAFSRMVQKNTVVNGTTYTSRTEYDANYGRVKAIEHASGIKVAYEYDPYGNLLRVKNAGSGFVYQENLQADALQNITQSEKNNGTLFEDRTYDPVSGQLKGVSASSITGNELHYIDYYYGSFGNLASQTVYSNNGASSSTESYSYDSLHRLTSSSLTSGPSISYSYDATGNLTQKSDYASSMSYGSSGKNNTGNAGPNAVLSATLVGGSSASFTYDNNGNLTSGAGKSITYNAMNKPTQISAGGTTVSFSYDANWQRYKKVIGGSRTLYYIDGSVEIELVNGETITRTYIDDIAVVKRIKHSGLALPSHEITYTLRDRLGSVVTLTNHNNLIMEHRSFDPFGKPRYGTMQASPSATLFNVANGTPFTMRGFTDHEHIDEAQLIHMNGRVYDYNLGRFLSVDPFIQNPGNSQSLNPYSYIMNNPLAGTDPSGYLSVGNLGFGETQHCSFLCMVGDTVSGFQYAGSNGLTSQTVNTGEVVNGETAEIGSQAYLSLSVMPDPSNVTNSKSETDFLAQLLGFGSEEEAENARDGLEASIQESTDQAAEAIDRAASEENLATASNAMSAVAAAAMAKRLPQIAAIAKATSLALGAAAALRSDDPGEAIATMIGLELVSGRSVGTVADIAKGVKGDGPSVTKDLIDGADELISTAAQNKVKEELKNEQP